MSKAEVILEHLTSLQGGRTDAALEFCLALKIAGCIGHHKSGPWSSSSERPFAALNRNILVLLGLFARRRGPYGTFTPLQCPLTTDLAAITRRLYASMEEHGCQDIEPIPNRFGGGSPDCTCHRRASLELLHFLQIAAWSQVRAKVYMTLGRLVSAELCEMLWLYTMAAEEIPLDPRATLPPHEIRYPASYTRMEPDQRSMRDEYRCPRFRGVVGDRVGRA